LFNLTGYVITISRQFGSLGRPVARKMAEMLGIEYYDRDIVERVERQINLPVSEIDDGEELDTGEYEKMKYPLGTNAEEVQERIFEAQKKVIAELAEKGSCIFVGRCSDYILRNHNNHFSIFIYAPYEVRRDNCIKILHMNPADVDQMIADVDEACRSYSMHYAKTYSENVLHKDILIDSSTFGGVDETAKVLVDMVRYTATRFWERSITTHPKPLLVSRKMEPPVRHKHFSKRSKSNLYIQLPYNKDWQHPLW